MEEEAPHGDRLNDIDNPEDRIAAPRSLLTLARGSSERDSLEYSIMKLGRVEVIDAFASRLAHTIRRDLGVAISSNPEEWLVTDNMFCQYGRLTSYQLAQRIAELLSLPVMSPWSGFRLKTPSNYPALGVEARRAAVEQFELTLDAVNARAARGRKLIDEWVFSGSPIVYDGKRSFVGLVRVTPGKRRMR